MSFTHALSGSISVEERHSKTTYENLKTPLLYGADAGGGKRLLVGSFTGPESELIRNPWCVVRLTVNYNGNDPNGVETWEAVNDPDPFDNYCPDLAYGEFGDRCDDDTSNWPIVDSQKITAALTGSPIKIVSQTSQQLVLDLYLRWETDETGTPWTEGNVLGRLISNPNNPESIPFRDSFIDVQATAFDGSVERKSFAVDCVESEGVLDGDLVGNYSRLECPQFTWRVKSVVNAGPFTAGGSPSDSGKMITLEFIGCEPTGQPISLELGQDCCTGQTGLYPADPLERGPAVLACSQAGGRPTAIEVTAEPYPDTPGWGVDKNAVVVRQLPLPVGPDYNPCKFFEYEVFLGECSSYLTSVASDAWDFANAPSSSETVVDIPTNTQIRLGGNTNEEPQWTHYFLLTLTSNTSDGASQTDKETRPYLVTITDTITGCYSCCGCSANRTWNAHVRDVSVGPVNPEDWYGLVYQSDGVAKEFTCNYRDEIAFDFINDIITYGDVAVTHEYTTYTRLPQGKYNRDYVGDIIGYVPKVDNVLGYHRVAYINATELAIMPGGLGANQRTDFVYVPPLNSCMSYESTSFGGWPVTPVSGGDGFPLLDINDILTDNRQLPTTGEVYGVDTNIWGDKNIISRPCSSTCDPDLITPPSTLTNGERGLDDCFAGMVFEDAFWAWVPASGAMPAGCLQFTTDDTTIPSEVFGPDSLVEFDAVTYGPTGFSNCGTTFGPVYASYNEVNIGSFGDLDYHWVGVIGNENDSCQCGTGLYVPGTEVKPCSQLAGDFTTIQYERPVHWLTTNFIDTPIDSGGHATLSVCVPSSWLSIPSTLKIRTGRYKLPGDTTWRGTGSVPSSSAQVALPYITCHPPNIQPPFALLQQTLVADIVAYGGFMRVNGDGCSATEPKGY